MSNLPHILLGRASVATDLNRIFAAMDKGSGYFTRELVSISDPNGPTTYWGVFDNSAQESDRDIFQGMALNRDLPPISGEWGVDGVIGAAEAQAALAPGNLIATPAAGLAADNDPDPDAVTFAKWRDGVLLGAGLMFKPEET